MKRENCKEQAEQKPWVALVRLESGRASENAATEKCQQTKPRTTHKHKQASVCVCASGSVCVCQCVCLPGVFLACLLTLEIEQPKMCKQVCKVQVRCCLRQLPETLHSYLPACLLACSPLFSSYKNLYNPHYFVKYDKHLKPENRIRRASTARDKLLRQGNIGKLRGGGRKGKGTGSSRSKER